MTVVPAMSFRDWQPRYAAHGIATFPVRVGDDGKVPAIRGWQRVGLPGSVKLGRKFADADAFGFCPGRASGLTILDVDYNRRAHTCRCARPSRPYANHRPLWFRQPSGLVPLARRRRLIRPDRDPKWPIDILGSGFVVAPPSHGIKSNYQFIQGGLDDLDHLPVLRGIETATSLLSSGSMPRKAVTEGSRNNTLWRHCMQSARHCDNFESLLDVARTRNADFLPPLTDSEVVKIASSAWDYTQRGENRFGRHGAFFDSDEANHLITSDQDVFVLLAFLRANNGPTRTFIVANALAKEFGWGRKRLADARRRMEGTYIEMVRRPSKANGAAHYRWVSKGGQN